MRPRRPFGDPHPRVTRIRVARMRASQAWAARPHRRAAALAVFACVAALACAAALALAACGGGEGTGGDEGDGASGGRTPTAGELRLVVSRDFGAEVLRDVVVPAGEKSDALRVLAENADVDTGYGGQFVSGIDGIKSTFGGGNAADAADWFYWVDGVIGDVGAADFKLEGGETVWWDFHRWADAMFVPLALHAFPRPYAGRALAVTAAADVAGLGDWAAAAGLEVSARRPVTGRAPDGGVVLATAAEAADTPWLLELLGATRTGVEMVRVAGGALDLVALSGQTGPRASAVALPAVNTDHPERPFLVVVGATAEDVDAILPGLTAADLSATVGVALVDGELVRLPWQGE